MQRANERIPPHSLEAERAVLGGLLLQNSAIDVVLEIVKADDFYSEANARIFEIALDLHRSSQPVDTVTLASGQKMPLVGFGLWKVPNDQAADIVYNVYSLPQSLVPSCQLYSVGHQGRISPFRRRVRLPE